VDGSSSDRHLLRSWLTEDCEQNYQILEAEDITKALQIWRSIDLDQNIDLIITDIDFPTANSNANNGLDLLKAISNEARGDRYVAEHKLPILVTTRNQSAKIAVQAMQMGVFDYLDKDKLTAESLQKAICRLIEYLVSGQLIDQARKLEEKVFQDLQIFTHELQVKLKERTSEIEDCEQKFRTTIDLNRIGCWSFDVASRQFEWNSNYFELMGLSPTEAKSECFTWRDPEVLNDRK